MKPILKRKKVWAQISPSGVQSKRSKSDTNEKTKEKKSHFSKALIGNWIFFSTKRENRCGAPLPFLL